MATANDRLVWIDCEMTGLDLAVDELVEVAVVITDFDLVPVHPGFDIVIKPDQSALDNMNEFVTNMHTTSGLIEEIPRGKSLGEALLTPTQLYVKSALAAIHSGGVKGLAHITGGGITDNLPRALPAGIDAEVELDDLKMPPVFGWMAGIAGIDQAEMLRTFNCGIGMVAICSDTNANSVIDAFQASGQSASRIGKLIAGVPDGEAKVAYRGTLKI